MSPDEGGWGRGRKWTERFARKPHGTSGCGRGGAGTASPNARALHSEFPLFTPRPRAGNGPRSQEMPKVHGGNPPCPGMQSYHGKTRKKPSLLSNKFTFSPKTNRSKLLLEWFHPLMRRHCKRAQKNEAAGRGKIADARKIITLPPKKKKQINDTWLSSAENRNTWSAKRRRSCLDENREEAARRRKKRTKQFSKITKKNGQFAWKVDDF